MHSGMSEFQPEDVMHAKKPEGDGDLLVEIVDVKNEKLGGYFPKSKLKVLASGGKNSRERSLDVIVKEVPSYRGDTETFGGERISQTSAQRYYHRWKYLREIGIPVVSSMRVVDAKRVVMGDMTADGSAFVGQETLEELRKNEGKPKWRDITNHEKLFLNFDKNIIKLEVLRIFEIAWKKNIRLSTDEEEFAVLVNPNGDCRVIVRDYGEMHKLREPMNTSEGFNMCCGQLEERVDYLFEGLDKLKRNSEVR